MDCVGVCPVTGPLSSNGRLISRQALQRSCWGLVGLVLGLLLTAFEVSAHEVRPDSLHSVATAEQGQVYRIAVEPEEVETLRQRLDVWAYLPLDKEAVVLLDEDELQRELERGTRLKLDEERTASLERHRALQAAALKDSSFDSSTAELAGHITGYPCYRTVDATYAALAAAAAAAPELARWEDIGDSWRKTMNEEEGFDHHVLVLTDSTIPGPKPVLMVMAAMHPREYVTAEVATRFALDLLHGYGNDPEITWLLRSREIHVIPQQNPDGRKEVEDGAFWRKNTNNDHCGDTLDRGVDLNRNSPWFWGGPLASFNPCDLFFLGPSAKSEPETQNIHDYMDAVFLDQKGDMDDPAPLDAEGVFISLHSFGEVLLYPWHGTSDASPNLVGLRTLGRRMGYYNGYSVCQDCIGSAGGTTPDAAYGDYGVPAFTFEMGTDFVETCSRFENLIYPGNYPALIYAAKVADRPYTAPSGPTASAVQVSDSFSSRGSGSARTVTALVDDSPFFSGGFGVESVQNIVAAKMGFDDATLWETGTSMLPVDGSFDSPTEEATGELDLIGLQPGRHLVFVVGQDASGRWGTPSAAFLEVDGDPAVIFGDSFESGGLTAWSDVEP